jgi:hypothetical protein
MVPTKMATTTIWRNVRRSNLDDDGKAIEGPKIAHLENLAHWLDDAFQVPGVGWKFGVDAVLDLIPGIGDALGALASLYIFQAAKTFGLPRVTLVRMATNIAIDYLGGLLPFVGAIFDAYWKANLWNVRLLQRHLNATPLQARKARRGDGLFIAAVVAILIVFMVAASALSIWLIVVIGQFLIHGRS